MKTAPPLSWPVRRVAVVLAMVVIATVLTARFAPLIRYTGFAFFYGAVTAAALYAGPLGGVLATVAGVMIVSRLLAAQNEQARLFQPVGFAAIFAFVLVSMVITALVESMRRARATAEERARELEQQAGELEKQRREAEALAEELEDSNLELEATTDDAKRARDAALAGEERLRLVDEASRILSSSLDYETTVTAVARLAVPNFADWCAVDLLEDGEIKRLAVAHVDPEKARWVRDVVDAKFRPMPETQTGVPAVIRSGKPILIPVVTDDMLAQGAVDAEHLAMLRAVGIRSAIIVPISARDKVLGALTLIGSRIERQFDDTDLAIAQDLSRRAGLAIDNARLYRAALAANEAKATFLATMSHELRTPLTAIIGYEELLSDGITGPIDDAQRQQLGRIKVSAMHLLSLIDQILLYTRVEAGQEVAQYQDVLVKEAVNTAVTAVLPTANERKLPILVKPIDEKLRLKTDKAKLSQMLINLLINAVKFTRRGEVTVGVTERDTTVVFEIHDTGVGIEQKNIEHIFDPFWQVQQTTTRESGGSGLGLTVTQRLATLLGGHIRVESERGKGSTFQIVLPKEPPPVREPEPLQAPSFSATRTT